MLSRRRTKKIRPVKAKTAKDAIQDRKIKRLEDVVITRELKWQDVAGASNTTTWNGSLQNLFAPAQGDTDVTRTGDQVAIERIDFRINGGMTAAGSNQFRVILLRDKTGSIGTTVSNVLYSGSLGTANAAHSPFNEDLRQNFEVLFDKTMLVDSVSNYQFQTKYQKRWKKPKRVYFNNNTTTVNKGQIKVLFIADILAPNFAYDYYCRIWYSDL